MIDLDGLAQDVLTRMNPRLVADYRKQAEAGRVDSKLEAIFAEHYNRMLDRLYPLDAPEPDSEEVVSNQPMQTNANNSELKTENRQPSFEPRPASAQFESNNFSESTHREGQFADDWSRGTHGQRGVAAEPLTETINREERFPDRESVQIIGGQGQVANISYPSAMSQEQFERNPDAIREQQAAPEMPRSNNAQEQVLPMQSQDDMEIYSGTATENGALFNYQADYDNQIDASHPTSAYGQDSVSTQAQERTSYGQRDNSLSQQHPIQGQGNQQGEYTASGYGNELAPVSGQNAQQQVVIDNSYLNQESFDKQDLDDSIANMFEQYRLFMQDVVPREVYDAAVAKYEHINNKIANRGRNFDHSRGEPQRESVPVQENRQDQKEELDFRQKTFSYEERVAAAQEEVAATENLIEQTKQRWEEARERRHKGRISAKEFEAIEKECEQILTNQVHLSLAEGRAPGKLKHYAEPKYRNDDY